jgi:hypothetical protein
MPREEYANTPMRGVIGNFSFALRLVCWKSEKPFSGALTLATLIDQNHQFSTGSTLVGIRRTLSFPKLIQNF